MEDLEQFIKNTYPFNRLPVEEIRSLCNFLLKREYQKGDIIFKEGNQPLEFLYIVNRGEVFLEKNNQLIYHLKERDIFGYVSLLGELPPATTARVVEDNTVILQLPKEIFIKLISKYDEFAKFFTKELAKRVHRLPQTKTSFQMERLIDVRIKDIKLKDPIIIDSDINLQEAIKLMAEKDSTFCLVRKNNSLGIITERDIIKKVLAKDLNPQNIKAEEIATFPVIEISSSEPLFNALLTMAKHGIRKLIIKDGNSISGVLDDRTVISHESKNIIFLIKEIDKAKKVEELSYLYSIIQDSIIEGVLSGMDPEYVGKYISELNDRFMMRTSQLTENFLGSAPSSYSIMVIGSEGRREQSLKTDQDNALIYENEHKIYFEKFSQTYIDFLLKIGFPPCPGNVMISNSYWRRNKEEWFKEINKWIENPKPENILNISIFFDFRNVAGVEYLAEDLRDYIKKKIKTSKTFLPFLASESVKFKPPLSFFKTFVVEKTGEHKGKIDIKKYGIFPIVHGVRVLTLDNEIVETNTFERIRALRSKGVLTDQFSRDLEESYRFLMSLRLKSQAIQLRDSKKPDNFIDPHILSKTEKGILKESFKKIEEFQKFLFDKYNLRYFS
ncbi:MAG: putative nucleotidyltransferase substrate binding domain-containing protein [Thermodesulfovibrio sp.]|uniref:putative nucleotidyltransferase substrate binding domain-containing protein n=1 Tax=unclassified Thermodesulfovibrio TaxID=2645936 RepID=UPI00083A8C1A|nr:MULTISPECIES: putative nucleotidyltransferase substrate binding domain-containing protein [unclassified Thermodesulfovibrio]MDI1471482.1 putative nucleotidyltransferase substrate binding domain-containing protein [Thermodesulfovibrio sp. 1176]MDI6715056.1 putative nucleotidyltransferase substrate binding domain-containing protein [Thermodesulfovibrio sp.]ODA43685.1 putative signal-transduction protein containing cAMP-binding and CBS domains [Thermodesulfovibrio sp. N1]